MESSLNSVQVSLRALQEIGDGLEIELENQIVTRADRSRFPDQVKIISGGGAGHEPGHVGFVGRAFLTTAISGAIFTSPPVQAILKGILLTGPKDTSILMIVTNYSGDRLNFALAQKMAQRRYGYQNIRTILVTDDVALDDVPEQVGNRGLAGTILIHKIAGAMADSGKSLDEIYSICERVNKHLMTIGFSYDVDLSGNWIRSVEIGKGVHGEPGAYKLADQRDFSEIIKLVADKFKRIIPEGAAVVVLLNNLGGPSHIFHLICHEIIRQLDFVRVVKVIAGSFFTSLGNSGASVTLLQLPEEHEQEILAYLEYDTDLFREHFKPKSLSSSFIQATALPDENKNTALIHTGVEVNEPLFKSILLEICEKVLEHRSSLNEMDTEFGDGDTGDTMARGAMAVGEFLAKKEDCHYHPLPVFQSISYLLSCRMGGTSGALLGIFFESAAEAFKTAGFGSPLWLQLGNRAIAEAGRSKRGHRTMLDVLLVAQELLEGTTRVDNEFLVRVKEDCNAASEATREMIPESGRAVYSRSNAMEKSRYPDPGAACVALIVETVVAMILAHQQ